MNEMENQKIKTAIDTIMGQFDAADYAFNRKQTAIFVNDDSLVFSKYNGQTTNYEEGISIQKAPLKDVMKELVPEIKKRATLQGIKYSIPEDVELSKWFGVYGKGIDGHEFIVEIHPMVAEDLEWIGKVAARIHHGADYGPEINADIDEFLSFVEPQYTYKEDLEEVEASSGFSL